MYTHWNVLPRLTLLHYFNSNLRARNVTWMSWLPLLHLGDTDRTKRSFACKATDVLALKDKVQKIEVKYRECELTPSQILSTQVASLWTLYHLFWAGPRACVYPSYVRHEC
jgi:hypothetical protein